MPQTTEQLLTHHWAMDPMAAGVLSDTLSQQESERIHEVSESLDPLAVAMRDHNRMMLGRVFRGEVKMHVSVKGPCSADDETLSDELLDVLDWHDTQHDDIISATRINGAKPRTQGGWRGLAYSTNPAERAALHAIYRKAMQRGRPAVTEITDPSELGEFAPYLSGFWLGARDMASTALRAASSLIHLPVGAKNGMDGSPKVVENTLQAIGMNTVDNKGSGVNLGVLAAGPGHRGIPTGILPIRFGNDTRAIIARGYALPEGTSSERGRQLAIEHLSQLCTLATNLDSVVLIDKTHGAPAMFGIGSKDQDRFPQVNEEIAKAVEAGEIENADRIIGDIAEVSTAAGQTDPNFIVNGGNRQVLSDLTGRAIRAVQLASL